MMENGLKRERMKILLAGILLGSAVTCLIFVVFFLLKEKDSVQTGSESVVADDSLSSQDDPDVWDSVNTESSQMSEGSSDGSGEKTDLSGDWAEWDKSRVYNGGDEVAYKGKIYRAKWWTQGERPGSADVWEDTMIAVPAEGKQEHEDAKASISQGTSSKQPQTQTAGKTDGTKVVAYYPSWRSDQSKLHYDIVTHVIYAFAIPTAEGGLRPLEGVEQVPGLILSAHESGAKVLLGVGGWSYQDVPLESTFLSATETPNKTSAFADAIVSMCEKYGFDGVDMDWEHPRVDGSSAAQYENLMLILAEKLHSRGRLLTSAVLSGATPDGNIYYDAAAHSDKVLAAVDWINVMAYDGGDGERHSGYEFAVRAAGYWRDTRGVPAEKVVLGVPFYSRPGWASYENILASVASAKNADHVNYNGMDVWYNGPATIRKKAAYAADQLGGVMIWEITQDTSDWKNSLLNAIGEGISK